MSTSTYPRLVELREAKRSYVRERIEERQCVDCGESDPRVLTFAHDRGPSILTLASQAVAWPRLRKAIEGCDSICRNCQRLRELAE